MPHQLTLKRETAKQYKLVRRAGVPDTNAKFTLQKARKESIAQVNELNTFLSKKHPTTGAITHLIDYHLNPLRLEKERLSALEEKGKLTELEIAELNIHIRGWEWLKAHWLPKKKDFSYSAVMGHHKKQL